MQANAVFAIFLVFVGVCMIESFKNTEEKCPHTLEDMQLAVQCVNKTKNGSCDWVAFIEDPENYLSISEQRTTAVCMGKGKNVIKEDGTLDMPEIHANIQKMNATEEIKGKLCKAADDCVEENKKSNNAAADTLICGARKAYEICRSNSTASSA